MTLRIGFLVSHPIQYYAPLFRALARQCDLTVYFAHRQTPAQQAKAGFDVAFDWDIDLLSGYESRFLKNVARHPSTDHFNGCNTPDIVDEIRTGRFDAFVVPGWALRSYLQAVRACRRFGVPVLVRGDSQLVGRRNAAVRLVKAVAFARLLRQFDGYLCVGQRNREYLLHYGAPPERLFFSPACVDNEFFRAGSEAARQAAAPTRGETRRRILFVGKLIERKRPLDLVQAAACVKQIVDVEVAFAGSGALASELARAANASGLPAIFHGFVNQSAMPAVYTAADLLVLPSDGSETWGLAVNEAMACGIPAAVSDTVGCTPDLIEPGATGATFPLGDVAAMADAIISVLKFDAPTTRRHLAARMEAYSPARAALGVVEGANGLRGRPLIS